MDGIEQCDVCDREAQPQCVCRQCEDRLCNECLRTCWSVYGCGLSFCARCQSEHDCDGLMHEEALDGSPDHHLRRSSGSATSSRGFYFVL